MRVSVLVYPLAGQCIVYIRQRYHLGRNGDLVSHQPVRVALAIVPFMVPAADLVSNLDQRLVTIQIQVIQHLCTDQGVGFHNVKFFFGQAARLVQDLIVNGNFANVVQRGSRVD